MGLFVVVWLIREVGVDNLEAVIVPALAWTPLAAAFEVGRIGMDTLSSRQTLGKRGHEVPWLPLFGSHLVAFAVMGVAPAGRATAEAVKASLLARWIGAPTAAALGTANQANTLLSSGSLTAISTVCAYLFGGFSVLMKMFLVHTVLMNIFGLSLRAAARYERLGGWLATRFPSMADATHTFVGASRETSLYPALPVSSMMFGRVLQAAHFGVLIAAVGLDPSVVYAFVVHGVYLVIAALGVMIPGQIGASEGGFQGAHELLHMSGSQALAIALLAHVIQLALVAVGFLALALWPGRKRAAEA